MMWSRETTTVEDVLGRLIKQGYRFVHPRNADGEIVTIVGVRAHGDVIDVVRLDAEDDVTAMRMPGDEADVLEPKRVLWRRSGAMDSVVGDLLELSDEDHATRSPARSGGCWVSGSGGRAKWLMATA
ncbi:hypothetical protein SAMN05421630_106171 [Prauserella marina]|uniref:Uncharacterized protein n=1 Tax=Prauserella marina TaxID=530584 RepID=A0A1G6SHT6_9PSEU|nr:hypothetical protein DES30_102171 [Prauserella marina]SDD15727.1 hypothetical protein SAMN05421630_106171 [Prauserella marina]